MAYQVVDIKTGKIISLHRTKREALEGQGVGKFFKGVKTRIVKTANKVGHALDMGVRNVEAFGNKLLFGRVGLSPHVQEVLKNRGHLPFKIDEIRRAPVPSAIQDFINKMSGDKVPYDTLFHLSIVGTFPDGQRLIIEKNAVINMSMKIYKTNGTEIMPISDTNVKTLDEIMENTKNAMGDKFIRYSAHDNNCQDFILALLHANGINNPQYDAFVKQDTQAIFKGNPLLRKFANTATDLGNRADILVQGGYIGKQPNRWIVHVQMVAKAQNIPYKDALKIASRTYK